MKNRGIIIIAIIFFLLVNTSYYWEGKLDIYAFPVFLFLIIVYVFLAITFIHKFYLALKEKPTNKKQFIFIGGILLVLILTFIKPNGIINFDKLEGNDILIAEREGVANCMTTLKLKDNFTFKERNVCGGVSEIKGAFHLQSDTIYFDNVKLDRGDNEYYKYAVIKPSKNNNKESKYFNLIRYKNIKDTIGHELWISKNMLKNLKKLGNK